MDALLFDMDDTLYDHLDPFALAYKDMFAGTYTISVDHLFSLSRKYSDKAFERLQCGGITMDELCIYRIQKAFQELQIEIPAEQAREFQRRYAGYQMKVRISDKMKEILSFCREKVPLGIINKWYSRPSEAQNRAACYQAMDSRSVHLYIGRNGNGQTGQAHFL